MRQSICVITEDLTLPLDEGIKIFAHSLIRSWSRECRALGLSVHSPAKIKGVHTIAAKTNKFFLGYKLWTISRRFRPDVVCYVPSASATLFSFLRSRLLKLYWPHARVIMVSLQPRYYGWLSRHLIPFLSPDKVFVQDEPTMRRLCTLGCNAQMLPSGVDLNKFIPVSSERKMELRTKYRLDPKAFTILHVGHIKKERNIELLVQVRRLYGAQVILVGSSLPHKERTELTAYLRGQGIIVLDKYLGNIQELYQLSDCYLFLVFSSQACIGTPLSVLEAMACNLPVITVRYGSLPKLFEEGQGLFFADTPEELLRDIASIKRDNGYNTRSKVLPYSWQNIAKNILNQSGVSKGQY
jgi:glycosyltransferase involved in cell wall biosynthesis